MREWVLKIHQRRIQTLAVERDIVQDSASKESPVLQNKILSEEAQSVSVTQTALNVNSKTGAKMPTSRYPWWPCFLKSSKAVFSFKNPKTESKKCTR